MWSNPYIYELHQNRDESPHAYTGIPPILLPDDSETKDPVTLAAKAHIRNERPLLIAVSTNDALSVAAANIGRLLNNKNIYFVPMKQDDCIKKPRSIVADFDKTYDAIICALKNIQIQPIFT